MLRRVLLGIYILHDIILYHITSDPPVQQSNYVLQSACAIE